jgi:hypothetical protein
MKARRQELHGKIAKVIEERWPNTEATEPELLAHHYTEAKLLPKAIPLWEKAGSLALKRMALVESIAHLNKGLQLVTALPPSAECDASELDLRILSGTSWIALRGPQVPEVWNSMHSALGLARSLHRNDALLPILWVLFNHVRCCGRLAESLRWVARMQEAAETFGDLDLLIVGHQAAVISHFFLGDLIKTRGQSAVEGYDYSSVGGTGVFGYSLTGTAAEFIHGSGGNNRCTFDGASSGWSCTASAAMMDNRAPVDFDALLSHLSAMPIAYFTTKGATVPARELGPSAEDFRAAFGLGRDGRSIAEGNESGVALAAAQGLYRKIVADEAEIAAQRKEIAALEKELVAQRTAMARLATALAGRAPRALLAVSPAR